VGVWLGVLVTVDVTTSGVILSVGDGSVPVEVMVKVTMGVGVDVTRLSGAKERAIKPTQ